MTWNYDPYESIVTLAELGTLTPNIAGELAEWDIDRMIYGMDSMESRHMNEPADHFLLAYQCYEKAVILAVDNDKHAPTSASSDEHSYAPMFWYLLERGELTTERIGRICEWRIDEIQSHIDYCRYYWADFSEPQEEYEKVTELLFKAIQLAVENEEYLKRYHDQGLIYRQKDLLTAPGSDGTLTCLLYAMQVHEKEITAELLGRLTGWDISAIGIAISTGNPMGLRLRDEFEDARDHIKRVATEALCMAVEKL